MYGIFSKSKRSIRRWNSDIEPSHSLANLTAGDGMSAFSHGFWDTADYSLQQIGKGTAWLLTRNAHRAEDVAYAVLGGSLLCALFGAVTGFVISDLSHDMAALAGAGIGLLLGACVGVFFGSFVEAVDEYIQNVLASIRSR